MPCGSHTCPILTLGQARKGPSGCGGSAEPWGHEDRAALSLPSRQYLYSVEGSGRVLGRSSGSCPRTVLVVQEQVRSLRLRVTPRLKHPELPELVLPGRRGADVAGSGP